MTASETVAAAIRGALEASFEAPATLTQRDDGEPADVVVAATTELTGAVEGTLDLSVVDDDGLAEMLGDGEIAEAPQTVLDRIAAAVAEHFAAEATASGEIGTGAQSVGPSAVAMAFDLGFSGRDIAVLRWTESTAPEQHSTPPPATPDSAAASDDLAHTVLVAVAAELASHTMTVREITHIDVDTVVPLTRGASQLLDVKVNGLTVASGEAVTVDGRMGVRIVGTGDPAMVTTAAGNGDT